MMMTELGVPFQFSCNNSSIVALCRRYGPIVGAIIRVASAFAARQPLQLDVRSCSFASREHCVSHRFMQKSNALFALRENPIAQRSHRMLIMFTLFTFSSRVSRNRSSNIE